MIMEIENYLRISGREHGRGQEQGHRRGGVAYGILWQFVI